MTTSRPEAKTDDCLFEGGCAVCAEGLSMTAGGEKVLHFGIDEDGVMHVVTAKGYVVYDGVVLHSRTDSPPIGDTLVVKEMDLNMEPFKKE